MRKHYFLILSFLGLWLTAKAQTTTILIYDNVLFYDGYAALVNEPTEPDVIRLRNDLFTKKLTQEVLDQIGSTLTLNVLISAACDNYDRIGNVNLALVPKGAEIYNPNTTNRIELGRFITPFMNKNIEPSSVPYTFSVDNVAKILKDSYLNSVYDFWIELEVFGVPYAANTQVAGCAGRNDVFFGTLEFATNDVTTVPNDTFVLPLNFKKDLNNYAAGASDAIGTTVRTINFNVPSAINNASFYLITSNHGANSGGEEYNRRWHYISFDGNQVLSYRPGEPTCEPYRIYNTQPNGIYGSTPRTPAQWQSFSNWCPGSVIPIRQISLGNLAAGDHSFVISVPDAVFVGQQGYIPVSLYLQGQNTTLGTENFTVLDFKYYPNPAKNELTISANTVMKLVSLYDMQGRLLVSKSVEQTQTSIDVAAYSNGIYVLKVRSDNEEITKKIVKE
ncbi:peptide-N-glycosidase F-related protein [Flavobacterium sedimenticola]|uniref:Peptide-N-glycosidase F-related protein n=1 Tax=Flavobacterium sedimenticola TaxID=3043286 RepID=A0ABT6XSX7_9FLAO|nr:peptide-N-glycosidase F-related protein [Flavobacterium sedimenticola]MDI9258090.1 peptide-N-glycosidase F-related protein [Flavobacterium sedimenticola]